MKEWYTYIVECRDKSLYTGVTNDLEKRVKRHNAGKGGNYTRARRPVVLVYEENLASRSEALQREAEIKGMARAEKLQLVNS